jgi:regulator of protease activity HflC (stomatin/prohibitin superfamily)
MILTLIALVACVLVTGFAVFATWSRGDMMNRGEEPPKITKFWILAGVTFALLVVSLGFRIVPAGYVGVVTWFGQVEERVLQPGLVLLVPVAESIVEVETRVRATNFENLAAASAEYQDVLITGTLNTHVDGPEANNLYQDVGLDYDVKIVTPFLYTIIKEIVPEYEIDTILLHREEIRTRAAVRLNEKLVPYHIIVDDLAFAQIAFSPEYTAAIEDKQVQEQRVLTERQILEQKRIQAEQAVATARGEAEAITERARGQAEANRLLAESLSPTLIQWQAVQRLNDKIQVMLVPSDNNFLLDLRTLIPPQ